MASSHSICWQDLEFLRFSHATFDLCVILTRMGMREKIVALRAILKITPLSLLLGANPLLAQTLPADTNTIAVLPLETRRNHIYVRPRLKGAEQPVTMMMDTGFTLTTLKPDLVETLAVRRSGHTIIMGISGKEEAPVYDGLVFTFGNLSYAPRRVAALPSDRGSRRVDGTLGLSFFQRFVVEMDQNTLRLREPASFHYAGSGRSCLSNSKKESRSLRPLCLCPAANPSEVNSKWTPAARVAFASAASSCARTNSCRPRVKRRVRTDRASAAAPARARATCRS